MNEKAEKPPTLDYAGPRSENNDSQIATSNFSNLAFGCSIIVTAPLAFIFVTMPFGIGMLAINFAVILFRWDILAQPIAIIGVGFGLIAIHRRQRIWRSALSIALCAAGGFGAWWIGSLAGC